MIKQLIISLKFHLISIFFVSIASEIKEPIAPSNFDRLRTFCNEKLSENTSFSIPTLRHEKVETYLKILTSPRLQGQTILGEDY